MSSLLFTVGNLPRIAFGVGRFGELPDLVAEFGGHVLLVTGGRSLREGAHWQGLVAGLALRGIRFGVLAVEDEPSPALVDAAVERWRAAGIDVVVGIGGGSAIDAAKAIAALLATGDSVMEHLEDVGRGRPYQGEPLPFIAVPTTAGTGAEATRNAVLSVRGADGYKKSFRHERMVARVALVDPELLAGCPRPLMAAQGMDAFTQLLESLVSRRANPFTDALAKSGLEAVAGGFWAALDGDGSVAERGREGMAYGALLSGITLAQAGLGSVHGLAQPFGCFFPIPHGVACGTLLAAATAVNIAALRERVPESHALGKYAWAGRLLSGRSAMADAEACDALVAALDDWTARLQLPALADYGVAGADLPRIVAGARGNSMRTNPVDLTDDEIAAIVRARL
jgi:alcohol dehydrogenase